MYYDKKGIALIVVIIVIVIVSVAALGIAVAVRNALFSEAAKMPLEKTYFAAQQGVLDALRTYKGVSGQQYWDKIIDNTLYYDNSLRVSVGKDANFLRIDGTDPEIAGSLPCQLRRIYLKNLNSSSTITVNRMKVEWSGCPASFRLIDLYLNNTRRSITSINSGAIFTLAPSFSMTAQQEITNSNFNRWYFNQAIPNNATIAVTFYFTDGSSRRALFLNNGRAGNCEFTITSTGRSIGSFSARRTIEASYDTDMDKITSWQETNNHI